MPNVKVRLSHLAFAGFAALLHGRQQTLIQLAEMALDVLGSEPWPEVRRHIAKRRDPEAQGRRLELRMLRHELMEMSREQDGPNGPVAVCESVATG
jgi:hypothetical protein